MDRLVFVHGAGLDSRFWQYQADFFADSVAIDLPGHGKAGTRGEETVAAYAAWMARELGGPVTLVGHSLGSLIALETAARNPELVTRLVLVSTAATMPVHRDLLAAAGSRDAAAAAMILKWSLPRGDGYGRPKPWVEMLSDSFVSSAGSGVMAGDFAACDNYQEAVTMAESVRCPTLLLLGELDVMTKPKAAQPLAAALTDARVVVIEGAGHMLPLEKPVETNEAISLFLSST